MNISLTPHNEALVNQQVKSGNYASIDDVLHEALKLLEERDMLTKIKQETLRREVDLGLAELDRGEGKPFDAESIKARGRERLKRLKP